MPGTMSDAERHDIMAVDPDEDVSPTDLSFDVLRSGLESDDATVRTHAARVAAAASRDDPAGLAPVVPDLTDRLSDEQNVVAYQSLIALSNLAEEEPDMLADSIGALVEVLDSDLPLIGSLASRTLGYVALERPDLFTDQVEALVAAAAIEPTGILEDEDLAEADWFDQSQYDHVAQLDQEKETRGVYRRKIIAKLLVEVAEDDPEALVPYVDEFVALLDDDDAGVVASCTDVLGAVARADPDAAGDLVDPLCDCLDHHDQGVVVNAVTALGYAGDPAAIEPLRELADGADDDDRAFEDDVYALADETAAFLED